MQVPRREQRRTLIYYLKLFDKQSGELIGHIADITSGGVKILSEDRLESGRTLTLRAEWPERLPGHNDIEFTAKTLWCDKDYNPDYYVTGCQFIDPSAELQQSISNVVEQIGFRDTNE